MKRTTLLRRTTLRATACTLRHAEIQRKTQMKPGRKVRATAAESVRMEQVKRLGCICCKLNPLLGLKVANTGLCDAHHLLSGSRRRGHAFTLGLCKWHHQAEPPMSGMGEREAVTIYGPTVATGSKPFHAMYGSDDELLEFQNALLTKVQEVTNGQ